MPGISFGNKLIRYEIVRSGRRRTMCIEVTHEGNVIMRAPMRDSAWRLERFLLDKAPWVLKHLSATLASHQPRRYATGEIFPYLGRDYRLRIVPNGACPHVELKNGELVAYVSGSSPEEAASSAKRSLLAWYVGQATDVLSRRVSTLAQRTCLTPSRLTIRSPVHRWGSCSPKGSVNLNYKLVMAPPEVADYVIIHELCHLKVQNHSRRFWDLVRSFVTDHRVHRKWLRENGRSLDL